jgi:hypothetical protein
MADEDVLQLCRAFTYPHLALGCHHNAHVLCEVECLVLSIALTAVLTHARVAAVLVVQPPGRVKDHTILLSKEGAAADVGRLLAWNEHCPYKQ